MAMKHIEKYLERLTGGTKEEVSKILADRRSRRNENLFKPTSYERYVYKKNNLRLEGEW